MASQFWLTDAKFERLRTLFPSMPRADDRRMILGVSMC